MTLDWFVAFLGAPIAAIALALGMLHGSRLKSRAKTTGSLGSMSEHTHA